MNETLPLPGFEYNVWDKDIPIEKSSYIRENSVQFINVDGFKHDKTKLTMLDLFCGAGGFLSCFLKVDSLLKIK